MALYAQDSEDIIAAWDAEPGGRYWCLECFKPLKVRLCKNRIPHFYHLQLSPSCRLYSKSEDHLLLQLQVQNLLPEGEGKIEQPFLPIHRVSDVAWEKKKIVFEIQCSEIYPKEVARRTEEYQTLGYSILWILEDRAYNKRILRPAETILRKQGACFASFRRHTPSLFYDQFELFSEKKRVRKSRPLPVDLRKPRLYPKLELPPNWPTQIYERAKNSPLYFPGDLLDRALLASLSLPLSITMENWAAWERELEGSKNLLENFRTPLREKLNWLLAEMG